LDTPEINILPTLELLHIEFIKGRDLTLSCAAAAHAPEPERRGGCRQ
jgi:hypothetical protein